MHENPPARRTARKSITWIVIGGLIVGWTIVLYYRTEIRAHWWAHQYTRMDTADERAFYLIRLASLQDRAIPALGRLARDPREEVRAAAVRVLHHCPSVDGQRALLDFLDDASDLVAEQAAMELALRADKSSALPTLKSWVLDEASPDRARRSAVALERIGGPDAEIVLLEALPVSREPNLVAQVIDSLAMLGSEKALPLIESHLTDGRRVEVLPASQRGLRRAVAAMSADLAAKGIDPRAMLSDLEETATVASIAWGAVEIIADPPATAPATAPDSGPAGAADRP